MLLIKSLIYLLICNMKSKITVIFSVKYTIIKTLKKRKIR